METKILTYVLYASFSLSAFYLIYWLLLRKSTHFAFNRAYLITALCLSMALPYINIPQLAVTFGNEYGSDLVSYELNSGTSPQTIQPPNFETAHINSDQITPVSLEITTILFWLYVAGGTVMLLRLLVMIIGVWKLYRSARQDKFDGINVSITNKLKIPSSFLNILFVPESKVNRSDLDKIIAHEQVHIRQFHTLDILLAELVTAVQWFNPFAWLLKISLRNVHEYLADNSVLSQGIDARAYQMALLNYGVGKGRLSLVHTFTTWGIKDRIKMMQKQRSGVVAKWKTLALIPVAVVLLTAWANPQTIKQDNKTRTIWGTVYLDDNDKPIPGTDIMLKGIDINTVSNEDGSYELNEVPEDAKSLVFLSEGNGIVTIPILPEDTRLDVILKRHGSSMIRKSSGTSWLKTDPYPTIQQLDAELSRSVNQKDSLQPLIVIDGKIQGKSSKIIKGLQPEEIESLEVLKGLKAIERYGKEAENGAIIITTRKSAGTYAGNEKPKNIQTRKKAFFKEFPKSQKQHRHDSINLQNLNPEPSGQPLYILDGKQVKNLEQIKPEMIDKIHMIHGKEAQSTYGDAAKYGAVIITTINNAGK